MPSIVMSTWPASTAVTDLPPLLYGTPTTSMPARAFEQLDGEMRQPANTRVGDVELARIGLGEGDHVTPSS